MTLKDLESTILNLVKVVTNLGDKVSSMDSRIVEQNSIIQKQAKEISLLRSEIAGTSTKVPSTRKSSDPTNGASAAPPASETKRPIRQTRTNAAKTAAVKTKHTTSTAEAAKTPEVSRSSYNPTQTTSNVKPNDGESPLQGEVPLSATQCGLSAKPDKDNSEWQVMKRKRHAYKQRPIFTGSGKCNNALQTVEQLKYMQAWSFKPDTTEQSIMTHINKIEKCEEYFVEKRNIQTNRHAAFVIGVPLSLYEQIYSPTVWPPGVRLSEWTYFRVSPRERGASAAEATRAGPSHAQSRPLTERQ